MTAEEVERSLPYFYWLSNVPGVGDDTMRRLLGLVSGPEELYFEAADSYQQWLENGMVGQKQYFNLLSSRKMWNVYTEYEQCISRGIKMYPFYHPEFPAKLLEIPDCPSVVFVKGSLPERKKPSLAIIGARNCSAYGKRMAGEFGAFLGREGVQIISGMARGVDGISQRAALEGGGSSYAVLGCGVDICYPKENRALYDALPQNGGVISTYLPGVGPKAQFFPPRNRIISGLADAVLVIEAREKSGTLITVDMALEQGKEVYAVPGRIGDALSEGCNRLIAQGAAVALSPKELLEAVWAIKTDTQTTERGMPDSGPVLRHGFSELEKACLEELDAYPKSAGQIHMEVAKAWGKPLSFSECLQTLMGLCVKGRVIQENNGMYFRKKE